ncbi:MAG: hypothetical protein K0S23_3156 [Fluviicola sp.]|jgi:hypothetical protein|uniref:hypothetical protein n=1 Tax=Fluviicola sp. TaxID=1917219 RepID=UPI0026200911|nr:hypothetical protein [Fluviicola sp.]MDF3028849.1 hypothetical protein [Fluviicola sp.]
MKTFLLCIALISTAALYAQKKAKNDTLLILDFKTKKITEFENFKPRRDRTYNFQVTNINLNVYKLVINKTDTVVSTPLDFSAFSMLDPSGLASLTNSLVHTVSNKVDTRDAEESFNNELQGLSEKSKQYASIEAVFKEKTRILESLSILEELKKHDSILTARGKAIADLSKVYSEYYTTTVARFNRDDLSNNDFCVNNDSIIAFERNTNNYRKKLDELAESYDEAAEDFAEFVLNQKIAIKDDKLRGTAARIQKKIDDTKAEIKKIQSKVSEENIKIVLTKFSDIINNASRTYTSLPLQFNGDKSKLDISIIPQDKESRLPSYHSTYLLPKPSGFYLGIGPGLYYSNLYDDRFSTVGFAATDSTSNYRMIAEKQSRNEIGLSVLLKAGWKLRRCDKIGFHGTIGGGLSFTDPLRLRALYGGGISIGEKHCLTLDLLGSTGYVDVQSNTVNEQTIFTERPESMTVSVLRTKLAFSIGYLFTF